MNPVSEKPGTIQLEDIELEVLFEGCLAFSVDRVPEGIP